MRTAAKRTVAAAVGALAAVTVAVGTGVGTAGPADAHGACRSRTDRVTGLTASARVTCATAQKVAAAYDAAVMAGGSFPSGGAIRAAGSSCTTTTVGHESEETSLVRCAGGRGVVRFTWGV